MRSTYRVLAYAVAALVVVQAAAIAFGVFGLTKWVDDGGTLDKATMESADTTFTGDAGFVVHGLNGTMLIPLVALLLVVVSFFAKVPGGSAWAGLVLLAVVVQVALGIFSHVVPSLGALHGVNALVLLGLALVAGRRVRSTAGVPADARQPSAA